MANSVVSSPTLPPGFSRGGGGCCAGSDCGSSLDYSSDEEYCSTATSRPPMQKERSHGMDENRKRSRSRSADKEREAKKKRRLFDQKQRQQQEGEEGEDDDDMSNDQRSLSLSSMCVGCCESLRHHISTGCALPPCFVIVLHFSETVSHTVPGWRDINHTKVVN